MDVFTELVQKLNSLHYTVAAAESCTAGLFTANLAQVPGASDVLGYGFVVYSAQAKTEIVGVLPQTIAAYGVVSEQTAREMALGAAKKAHAAVGVGITGFAGPSADPGFPVGRVCFGYAINGEVHTQTVEYGGIGRNPVREQSALHAAQGLLSLLKNNERC